MLRAGLGKLVVENPAYPKQKVYFQNKSMDLYLPFYSLRSWRYDEIACHFDAFILFFLLLSLKNTDSETAYTTLLPCAAKHVLWVFSAVIIDI